MESSPRPIASPLLSHLRNQTGKEVEGPSECAKKIHNVFTSLGLRTGHWRPLDNQQHLSDNQLLRWGLRRPVPGAARPPARRLRDCLSCGHYFDWGGPIELSAGTKWRRGRCNRGPTASWTCHFPAAAGAGNCLCRRTLGPPGNSLLMTAFPLSLVFCSLIFNAGGGISLRGARSAHNAGHLCPTPFRPPWGHQLGGPRQ